MSKIKAVPREHIQSLTGSSTPLHKVDSSTVFNTAASSFFSVCLNARFFEYMIERSA